MNRRYRSTLREDQAKATSQRIVDALVAQACEHGRQDFSIAEVAARAGVAERTVYRHFPTRQALIEAIHVASEQDTRTKLPDNPDNAFGHVHTLFAWFEENAQLVEAAHVTGIASEVRAHGRRQRGERAKKMVDEYLALLPEADRRRALAVFRSMFGSATWRTMRRELGLSAEETVDAVEWVIGLVRADLEKRKAAAAAATTKTKTRAKKAGAR